MARSPLRTALGTAPFALILVTLAVFAYTRDAMVFAVGGLFACVYVLAVLFAARRRRTLAQGASRVERRRFLRRR